jgi:hypothetical protein
LIGNCVFAHDYGCMHSGMPLYRNHFRRSRDAPEVNHDQLLLYQSRQGSQPYPYLMRMVDAVTLWRG